MNKDTVKRLSASLEDHLEAIFWAVAAKGRARPRDIAQQLRVKASSVTGALQALAEKDYVQYEPYEAITLTRSGFEAGARVARRHHILRTHLAELLGGEGIGSAGTPVEVAIRRQRSALCKHEAESIVVIGR